MSVIEYIEPFSAGEMFVGIGFLIIACTLAYIFYKLYIKVVQYFDVVINRDTKYELFEESFLDKIAQEKGIDLNKELIRRNMLKKKTTKSFRQKIEEQILKDMFEQK